MKVLIFFSLICFISSNVVKCDESTDEAVEAHINIDVGEILRRITSELLNSRRGTSEGAYEVADDGSISFVAPAESSSPSYTPEPNLSNDEAILKDISYDTNSEWGSNDNEGTFWEFVPRQVDVYDPLRDPNEFPLINTNEVDSEQKENSQKYILERKRRDVKVDVGGQGGGSSGGVDVAVNKPGSNVNVNVGGGLENFFNQLSVFFNKAGSAAAASANHGGSGSVDVNVNKPGHGSNVDVNVGGGKPSKPVYSGASSNTAVNVDWASFIPFVNVGVNKGNGGSDVKVDVGGQNGGRPGSSFVDVKVNKGAPKKVVHEDVHDTVVPPPKKNVDVNVLNGFVDVKVDADHNGDIPRPPKKHHRKHHPHDDSDKNVNVNVGGQGGSWWPFVNVNVDAPKTRAASGAKKCVNINVPFVNVILNRGCTPEQPGDGLAPPPPPPSS